MLNLKHLELKHLVECGRLGAGRAAVPKFVLCPFPTKEKIKCHFLTAIIFTARSYAVRGDATVSRLSVCPSVRPSVCDVQVP